MIAQDKMVSIPEKWGILLKQVIEQNAKGRDFYVSIPEKWGILLKQYTYL